MEDSDGGSQWKDSEVLDLISIWGDTSMQAKLEGSYRNRSVFEKISKELAERGHRRTWLQCQRKVKSLKAKFKEAKDSNQRSGRGRITCPFYTELDRILGDKPSCQPLELLDSSCDAGEEEPGTPGSGTSSAGSDVIVETGDKTTESLPSTSGSFSGESSSSSPSTETCGKNTTASGATSAKSRKRKTKMDTTLEVFAEKISSALNKDDTDLQMKMQAAQHEHELKMFSMFTQFLQRSNLSPHPPFYQAPVQPPHLYNFTQSPPFRMASPQSPPFNETTNQPSSFLQDLAQPLPFNHAPAHRPDLAQPFSQAPTHPQDLARPLLFSEASAHPPFYRPPEDEKN